MTPASTQNLRFAGNPNARILVVCDSPTPIVHNAGAVMSNEEFNLFGRYAIEQGLKPDDFAYITPCPPIPPEAQGSDAREGAFIKSFQGEFTELCNMLHNAKLIVTFGAVGAKQALNGSVKITRIRGQITHTPHRNIPLFPMYSPRHAIRRPDVIDLFAADVRSLGNIVTNEFNFAAVNASKLQGTYEWCRDLTPLIQRRDREVAEKGFMAITIDTEFRSKPWYFGTRPLVVQLTVDAGHSYVCPTDAEYWNTHCEAAGLPPITQEEVDLLLDQICDIVGDARVFSSGHALNTDRHVLRNVGIEVANPYTDSMQLIFVVDENMLEKSLDEGTRRWLPDMAGYADEFNNDPIHDQKKHMERVPLHKMLMYGGGDTDAAMRLAMYLSKEGKRDARNWRCFRAVHMPSLRVFFEVEHLGIKVDITKLADLGVALEERRAELYHLLLHGDPETDTPGIPRAIIDRHMEAGLSFTRDLFVRDILFDPEGFGLTPIVFTKGTAKLSEDLQVPSISTKMHLPFFEEECQWIKLYIEHEKVCTMIERYVGNPENKEQVVNGRRKRGFDYDWATSEPKVEEVVGADGIATWGFRLPLPRDIERGGGIVVNGCTFKKEIAYPFANGRHLKSKDEAMVVAQDHLLRWRSAVEQERVNRGILLWQHNEATGFWKYLSPVNKIHPSYFLHRTVTGRTASAYPNAQNFPKRGKLAKAYRKIFIPDDGWAFVSADLSQAELRVAAWMANEQEMLRVYREDGDIHCETAAATMSLSTAAFMALEQSNFELYDLKRFQAKAVNFGFLYGMGWSKFKAYARTDYQIKFTDNEAKAMRDAFFGKYRGLPVWHEAMRQFVRAHGYVRAPHGGLRRLPNITSPDERLRGDCERQAINSPVQRMASDLGLLGLTRFARDCPADRMYPIAFIHDNVIVQCRLDCIDEAAQAIKFYMQTPPLHWFDADGHGTPLSCPIPIKSDVEVHTVNLGESKKRPDIQSIAPAWYRAELDESPPQ